MGERIADAGGDGMDLVVVIPGDAIEGVQGGLDGVVEVDANGACMVFLGEPRVEGYVDRDRTGTLADPELSGSPGGMGLERFGRCGGDDAPVGDAPKAVG